MSDNDRHPEKPSLPERIADYGAADEPEPAKGGNRILVRVNEAGLVVLEVAVEGLAITLQLHAPEARAVAAHLDQAASEVIA